MCHSANYIRRIVLISAVCVAAATEAQEVVFENLSLGIGQAIANGGAVQDGDNAVTRMVATPIVMTTSNVMITGFTFTVANLSGSSISARPIISFYEDDNNSEPGNPGLPGTLLATFSYDLVTVSGNSTLPFSYNDPDPFWVTGNRFWAGLTFDNDVGGAGTELPELESLGQGLFGPPLIGSSEFKYFRSTESRTDLRLESFPAGNLDNYFTTESFGWQFIGISSVPEPSSMLLALLALGVLGLRGQCSRSPRLPSAGVWRPMEF